MGTVMHTEDLERWLDALARDLPPPTTPRPDPHQLDAAARQVDPAADLVAQFLRHASRNGVQTARARADAWVQDAARRAAAYEPARVGICVDPAGPFAADAPALARTLDAEGVRVSCRPDVAAWAAIDVAITDADAAVAETGSVLWVSGPGRPRVATLLPRVHLVLVDGAKICADLLDLAAVLERGRSAGHQTLITGPSKTADIEGVLVTGVHGPGVVEALVVEGL